MFLCGCCCAWMPIIPTRVYPIGQFADFPNDLCNIWYLWTFQILRRPSRKALSWFISNFQSSGPARPWAGNPLNCGTSSAGFYTFKRISRQFLGKYNPEQCMPTLERFEDWVHQSMRDPVSHFPKLSNEETWKVLLFYSKSTVICCRSWSVVSRTSSWRRATGSSRCTTTTGTSTMWCLCLKTLRWPLHTLHSVSTLSTFAGVDGGLCERVPRTWGLRPWKVSVPSWIWRRSLQPE